MSPVSVAAAHASALGCLATSRCRARGGSAPPKGGEYGSSFAEATVWSAGRTFASRPRSDQEAPSLRSGLHWGMPAPNP